MRERGRQPPAGETREAAKRRDQGYGDNRGGAMLEERGGAFPARSVRITRARASDR